MKQTSLEKIILETIDIPSLPPIAMKVLQLISSDTSSIKELEEILSKDQSFSARLLRIANSPYYGKNRSVDSISSAIILIGFNTMKSLVVAASLKDMHRNFGIFEQKLWEHSLAVSLAASAIAAETKMMKPDEALVAGLVHDMGKIVLNTSLADSYALVIERAYAEGLPFLDIENDVLGFNHCNVGGLIARKWKLPKNLETVIEFHHTEDLSVLADTSYEVSCQITRIADAICLHLGIGFKRDIDIANIGLDSIGYDIKKIDKLIEKIKTTYEEQRTTLLQ
ncbi:MAG: HDOD domain-containing protein [Thermodesulfovibrionales bacterium]|nr:HDOD domain-containing protein [Thermodesulfovibrionales bacterium]